MIQRPLIIITVSYIIGILWGIYLQVNIYPICIILAILNISMRYGISAFKKVVNTKILSVLSWCYYNYKIINCCIIIILISNICIGHIESRFENLYKNIDNIKGIGVIIQINEEGEYYNNYVVIVKNINNDNKLKDTKIILKVKKDLKSQSTSNYKYGDLIYFSGTNELPEVQRNYKGFDYSKYLKTKNIYTSCKCEYNSVKFIKSNSENVINMWINNIRNKVKINLYNLLPQEKAAIANAILIGNSKRS